MSLSLLRSTFVILKSAAAIIIVNFTAKKQKKTPVKSDFMSLENFQMPIDLMSELYKDSLIVLDEKQISSESLKSTGFISLGNNKRNILLLVDETEAVHLKEENLDFLTGILTACKLTIADIALLNIANKKKVEFEQLIQFYQPETIIFFGINAEKLNSPVLQNNPYEIQKTNQINCLIASSLEQIAANVEEKKKLWACLKTIFSI